MSNALTLYAIETEMLELVMLRDELAAEVRVTPEDEAERQASIGVINEHIERYIAREIQKADNLAGFVRECEARSEVMRGEATRAGRLAKMWKDRADHVKERAAEVLAMQIDPQFIIDAKPNTVLKRIAGKTSELKLVKSTDGVDEPIDMSLLPEEMQVVNVSMSLVAWRALMEDAGYPGDSWRKWESINSIEPNKRAILAALKQRVPCVHPPSDPDGKACGECGGSGLQQNHVPGARLKHGVHVRIS